MEQTVETLTHEPAEAQAACKGVEASLTSRIKMSRSESCAACDVALANSVQELEAVVELHQQGVAKEFWDKDNKATTETMHQDNDNDDVNVEQAQMEIS